MTPDPHAGYIVIVWTALGVGACMVSSAACWLAQRVWLAVGPWVMADVDRFTGLAALLILASVGLVALLARNDPSW